MNRLFHGWAPWKGEIPGRRNGALISNDKGQSTAYALWNLEERGADVHRRRRGRLRRHDHRREQPAAKISTSIRSRARSSPTCAPRGKDEAIRLTPPRRLTLEQAIAWIEDDELVEVTPAAIRLRKAYLDPNERKRAARAKEAS